MFNRLKQARRIATRYDKTALSFASFLNLAASARPGNPGTVQVPQRAGAISRNLPASPEDISHCETIWTRRPFGIRGARRRRGFASEIFASAGERVHTSPPARSNATWLLL